MKVLKENVFCTASTKIRKLAERCDVRQALAEVIEVYKEGKSRLVK